MEYRGQHKYYYHSTRSGKKARKSYLGRGPAAHQAAAIITEKKRLEQKARELVEQEIDSITHASKELDAFCDGIDLLMKAQLITLGYHNTHRRWRERNAEKNTQSKSVRDSRRAS